MTPRAPTHVLHCLSWTSAFFNVDQSSHRRNASVRDERAIDVEVFEAQGGMSIPLILFLDDAEEPERRGAGALERENRESFVGFVVPVEHRPLLERDVPVV